MLGGQAGGRTGGRKYRVAWRGVGRASWLGRRAGRADWWEGAQARRVLAICSCFTVQRVLDVPPPRQPGARTRGCIAGAGRREAGRSGRRWAGLAGWCARWVGGDERHCKGHCTKYVCPAHTAHPRPSALCPTPQHATPLPPAAPAPPTSFLCGVPCLAIGLDQDIWQKPRARRRGHAEIHLLFLCGWGEGVSLQNSPHSCT